MDEPPWPARRKLIAAGADGLADGSPAVGGRSGAGLRRIIVRGDSTLRKTLMG